MKIVLAWPLGASWPAKGEGLSSPESSQAMGNAPKPWAGRPVRRLCKGDSHGDAARSFRGRAPVSERLQGHVVFL